MKKYFYFVLYYYSSCKSRGFGTIEITTDSELIYYDNIRDISKKLKEEFPEYEDVCILYWKLLRIEEDDPS